MIIIRTRDGAEFKTPYCHQDMLCDIEIEKWIPVWEKEGAVEDAPPTTLIRSADIISISGETDEDCEKLHRIFREWE